MEQQAFFVTQPSLGALSSSYPFVATDTYVGREANICLPALSGRVTVTPNLQTLHILAGNLTPADRTVFVRNTATGETFSYRAPSCR